MTAGGNPAADLYADAIYEMQGRLQTARVYEMTDDPGIRDTLSFMLARDLLHQQQFLAAIEELGGPTAVLPIPAQMTQDKLGENGKYAYAFMSYSQNPADTTAGQGRWANGPSLDGKGQYSYIAEPFALGMEANLPPAPATVFGGLPGDPVGPVQAPHQVAGASSAASRPSALASTAGEKMGDKLTAADMTETASGVRVGVEDPVVTVNKSSFLIDKAGDTPSRSS
ncbi:MAG: manganese catalase family protein [Chloroflexi bacterium]|nr:manganese catalase family protein [Chloroflexota bacterium]